MPNLIFAEGESPSEIWNEAYAAAQAAAKAKDESLPPENLRGFDCGFAWVVIKPARGAFVSWCKLNDKGRTIHYGGGGFQIWYSQFSERATQSVDVHAAAAWAFAEVLKRHGIEAYASYRLD